MSQGRLFGSVASALVRGAARKLATGSSFSHHASAAVSTAASRSFSVATMNGASSTTVAGLKLKLNINTVTRTTLAALNAAQPKKCPTYPPANVQVSMFSTEVSSTSPSVQAEVDAALTSTSASEEEDDARARIAFLTETGRQEGQTNVSASTGSSASSSSSKNTVRSEKLAMAMKTSLDQEMLKNEVLENTGKDYNRLQAGFDKLVPEAAHDPVLAKDLTSIFEYTSLRTGSAREMRKARIKSIIEHYQRREGDTGSTEVQIAVLTERIAAIEEHLRVHHKDVQVKRDFSILIHRRRKLLNYLRRQRFRTYQVLVRDLNIDEEAMANVGRLPTNRPFLPTPGRDPNRHEKLKRKSRRA